MSFKEKIDQILRQEKINNAQMAKRLDISPPAFSTLKTKKLEDVPFHYLDTIIEMFDLPDNYFSDENIVSEDQVLYKRKSSLDDEWTEVIRYQLENERKIIENQAKIIENERSLLNILENLTKGLTVGVG